MSTTTYQPYTRPELAIARRRIVETVARIRASRTFEDLNLQMRMAAQDAAHHLLRGAVGEACDLLAAADAACRSWDPDTSAGR